MASFLDKFKSAYENEYRMPFKNVSIYPKVLETKSKFSQEEKQRLLKKRWYIYFDYLNPETNKYERQTPITAGVNREFKDFDERVRAIRNLKLEVIDFLKEGNVPDKYRKIKKTDNYTIIDALDFALEVKKKENISKRTIEGYEKSVKAFQEWLKKTGKTLIPVTEAGKKIFNQFLSTLNTSNRTKNNYRSDLSAVFGVLVEQDILTTNPVEGAKKEKVQAQKDFNYKEEDFETVVNYLKENEPVLLMFINLVSFQFWRPKENCRIKISDIDLKKKTVKAFVKQGKIVTKLIPNILFEDLKTYLEGAEDHHLIFTPNGTGEWDRDLDGRRGYFTLKFKRLRKKEGWNSAITIYDFRHHSITKAYKSILSETGSHDRTIEQLSKITGHTSKAINNYIHYTDTNLPEDWSKHVK